MDSGIVEHLLQLFLDIVDGAAEAARDGRIVQWLRHELDKGVLSRRASDRGPQETYLLGKRVVVRRVGGHLGGGGAKEASSTFPRLSGSEHWVPADSGPP